MRMCFNGGVTAELDYAFLAEYAKTDQGTLTVIGASFTEVRSGSYPSMIDIAVAGRVRRKAGNPAPAIRIVFETEDGGSPLISIESSLNDQGDAVIYDGKVASVFAVKGPLPLMEPGLYECKIYLDGHLARRLAFEALSSDA